MISVVISIYNSEEHIERCLDSILRSTGVKVEIIVVVNSYTAKSKRLLENYRVNKNIFVYFLKRNMGRVYATNLGTKRSKSNFVMILDIDTKIFPSTLERLYKRMKQNKTVGIAVPMLIKGDTKRLDSADHFISPIGIPYEIGVDEPLEKHRREKKIFAAKCCGMMVRKNVFNLIGMFDPNFYMHGEETDLCWRCHLAGYEIIFFPKSRMCHYGKSSLNPNTKIFIYTQGIKNNFSYLIKNMTIARLLITLTLFYFFWGGMMILSLLSLDWKKTIWIFWGLLGGLMLLPKSLEKRKRIFSLATPESIRRVGEIMYGNLNFLELIKKGWGWIKNG